MFCKEKNSITYWYKTLLCAALGSFQSGNIRLVEGSNVWEGRVEVYISGIWATIDDTYWTISESQVVCRQLGHSTNGELQANKWMNITIN